MIKNAKGIDGWMSVRELLWLAEEAKKCMVIIECGSYKGRSTMALADNCPGIVIAVDPYLGDYTYENGEVMKNINASVYLEFENNLRRHIFNHKVFPVRCRFHQFITTLKPDLIFIDGDHKYEMVKKDIDKAKELLRPGGTISGHDYGHPDWPGVKQAVDECVGEIELWETIWWKTL